MQRLRSRGLLKANAVDAEKSNQDSLAASCALTHKGSALQMVYST